MAPEVFVTPVVYITRKHHEGPKTVDYVETPSKILGITSRNLRLIFI